MAWFIGTSGWQYRHWRGRFYPQGVPTSAWFDLYAEQFRTVEINNTFYRLPGREVFQRWAERAPDDFVFAVKMSRYLSHIKRLKDPQEPVARFLDRAEPLGAKLGPVLLQLPPTLAIDLDRLDAVLAAWPTGPSAPRLAIEFRHDSWYTPAVRARLEAREVALCLADRCDVPQQPMWRTAPWGFVRFHQGTRRSAYRTATLTTWVEDLRAQFGAKDDVFVYFNNDQRGAAIRDASRFAAAAIAQGIAPTRVPGIDLQPTPARRPRARALHRSMEPA